MPTSLHYLPVHGVCTPSTEHWNFAFVRTIALSRVWQFSPFPLQHAIRWINETREKRFFISTIYRRWSRAHCIHATWTYKPLVLLLVSDSNWTRSGISQNDSNAIVAQLSCVRRESNVISILNCVSPANVFACFGCHAKSCWIQFRHLGRDLNRCTYISGL